MLNQMIDKIWYKNHPIRWLLYPFSFLLAAASRIRRACLTRFYQIQPNVPLIVVGNLTVGGVGKTPLVIAIAQALTAKGIQVGIVSRGYGAQINCYPHHVTPNDKADEVGDEPMLLMEKSRCPVVISPDRNKAVEQLIHRFHCDVIISDDGLQHYKMGRSIEIVVIDGYRGLGNGMQLPAGPLREPASRINEVDFIVVNGGHWPDAYRMDLKPGLISHLDSGQPVSADILSEPVAAVAGIGNPERFFDTLDTLGVQYRPYAYPDHFKFKPEHMNYSESRVLMTEKDAVKCRIFADGNMMYLPVEANMEASFWQALWSHQSLRDLI